MNQYMYLFGDGSFMVGPPPTNEQLIKSTHGTLVIINLTHWKVWGKRKWKDL